MRSQEREGERENSGMSILVMVDHETDMTLSSVAPKKGVHAYSVVRVCNDLNSLGYNQVILKSDGEPAIMALKEALKAEASQRI